MITIELRDNEAEHLYELIKSFLNGELVSSDDDRCEELPAVYTKPYRMSYDMICTILEPFVFAEREHESVDFSELDQELSDPDFPNFDWEEVDDEENLYDFE